MKKLIILTTLLLAAFGTAVRAESTWGIAWTPGIPLGKTSDFTSSLSARGVSLEMRDFMRGDLAWGLSAGWNVFNQAEYGSDLIGTTTVTGNTWHYTNAIPLYASLFKYTSQDRRTSRFYYGLNAGAQWIELRTEAGVYAWQTDQWHFALAPEIGFQLPWSSFLGYVGLRYNYGFSSGDNPAQSWIDLKVGFGLD